MAKYTVRMPLWLQRLNVVTWAINPGKQGISISIEDIVGDKR
jgi:hypothetical protein